MSALPDECQGCGGPFVGDRFGVLGSTEAYYPDVALICELCLEAAGAATNARRNVRAEAFSSGAGWRVDTFVHRHDGRVTGSVQCLRCSYTARFWGSGGASPLQLAHDPVCPGQKRGDGL